MFSNLYGGSIFFNFIVDYTTLDQRYYTGITFGVLLVYHFIVGVLFCDLSDKIKKVNILSIMLLRIVYRMMVNLNLDRTKCDTVEKWCWYIN